MLRFDIDKIVSEIYGGAYIGRPFPNADEARRPGDLEIIDDGLNHNGPNGVFYMMPTSINGWQLPLEPAVKITGGKNIVATPLRGNTRRGSVKELINTDDYKIEIRGILMNEDSDNYPFEDLAKLIEMWEKNEALPIVNAMTKAYGIENIVIYNIDTPDLPGTPNVQPYFITAYSDEDFILIQD